MKEAVQYSKLFRILERQLLDLGDYDCNRICSQIHHEKLVFNVIGKDSSAFLTDHYYSIQVQYKNKNLEQESINFIRSPMNKLTNNYYFIKQKRWHPFNCRQELINQQEIEYSCPYQPQFYFKDDFKDFCEEKKKKKSYQLSCNRIRISKWRIKIVNVSTTGWYAPIIEAIDFKIEQHAILEDFSSVSLVMYEEKLRIVMQRLRLAELRQKKVENTQKQSVSLFYFLMDAEPDPANKRFKNLFSADTNKQMLQYGKDNLKYVLFGQYNEILTLTNVVNKPELRYEHLKSMNMENLKVLFNTKEIHRPKPQELELWSSGDEESVEEESPHAPMIDENEQDSDSQDPLRNLYISEFKRLEVSHK